MNITTALNVRENMKQKTHLDLTGTFDSVGKMTLCGMCRFTWIFMNLRGIVRFDLVSAVLNSVWKSLV